MSEPKKCSGCGAELPLNSPGEHCLQCLLKLGLDTKQESGPSGTIQLVLTSPTPTHKPGDWIGPYKLMQQIGEGGCGVVYMAEQEKPVHRRVALKVIKLGMDTKSVIARFEAERQALAMMDHPNIAKVLDAGATEAGRPYFVMELVRGIKITDYCDQNNLSTRERLDLFMQVCRAIQHAHQKGIIHRDIKPSNILVTMNDGIPMPKVIDFGIAKATHGKLTDQTLFTAFEQFIGTPAYMSPEQAEMSAMDIDTRSDIYSLGVLLYELLTGKTPFDAKELVQAGLDEIRRTIREKEPAKPSTCLSTMLDADLTTVAKHRKAEAPKLVNLVRGDLDWIVMKTLEKDRTRRYETASGLAADLQRHLSNEPVTARAPSNLYRFQKMMRRNKLVFAATTAVLLALLAGLGVSLYLYFNEAQARRAAQESARRARAEADKTGVIKKFLEEMFWANAPGHFVGRDTSVLHEMLDTAAVRVATDFTNQPDVSAELLLVIGENYRLLGDFQKAAAVYRQADEISRSSNPPDAERRAQILTTLGVVLVRLGNTSEAEQDFREAIRLYHAAPSPHPGAEAMPLQMLGMQLTSSRNYAAAEPLLRQALALSLQNKDVEGSAARYNALGVLLVRKQDFAGAEQMFSNSLAVYIALGSTNGAEYAKELTKIAEVRAARGDFAGAEMLYRKALAIDHLIYAKGHPDAISLLVSFGNFLEQHGDRAEAKDLLLEAANGVELGDITNSFTERWKLIKHFSATGDTNQVEQLLQTNYALAVQFPDQAGLYFIWTIQRLTLIWINEQKYPQAERLLLEGWSKAQSVSVSRIDLKNLCQNFIQLYQATGRTNEAALWRQKMRELPRATNNAPAISTNSSSAPAH